MAVRCLGVGTICITVPNVMEMYQNVTEILIAIFGIFKMAGVLGFSELLNFNGR